MKRLFILIAAVILIAASGARAITTAEIDAMLAEAQARAEVQPPPIADDAEFFRRLSLDVRGMTPSIEETTEFLGDQSPEKRAEWIEKFLASEERGEHWANYWDKVLIGTLQQPQNAAAQLMVKQPFKQWTAEQFNNNVPYSTFMREIVDAHGLTNEVPQALPLARWQSAPESMAGSMSRAFLGTQIQCAQCHDHKDNPALTQTKFWEFAAFFGNTRAVLIRNEEMDVRRISLDVRDIGMRWQMPIPDVEPKQNVTPRYLDGTAAVQEVVDENGRPVPRREQAAAIRKYTQVRNQIRSMNGDNAAIADAMQKAREEIAYVHDNRREQLTNFILGEDSKQFSANMVNRTWARFFGRGFMEPVDAWNTGIEPEHPELLDALTVHFRGTGYDVRDLERLILNTKAYQRSSAPTETSADYPEMFAHASLRPLTPDQLLASLIQATNAQNVLQGDARVRNREQLERLQQVYAAQFIHTFGNDEMEWANTFETSIPRALFLLNDSGINNLVKADSEYSVISRIASAAEKPADQAKYLYLAALSRMPSDEEERALAAELAAAKKKGDKEWKAVMEDAFWGLLNSTEFLVNH